MKIKGDFLSLKKFSKEEINYLISLAEQFKTKRTAREPHFYHTGKSIALIFTKPSTRTRISLEVASQELGLHPIYLYSETMQMARGESVRDTGRVLSRYADAISIRTYSHEMVKELATASDVPVINALTVFSHPLQVLGDLLTIKEFKGLEGTTVTFLGDGDNNVAHSLLFGCSKMGLNFRIGAPEKYFPNTELVNEAKTYAKQSGGSVKTFADPKAAVRDADIIYTDVWISMGKEDEREERMEAFKPYRVTTSLLKDADPQWVFMHCLPRQDEVTNKVFESTHSIVWEQAENRLHSAKAVIATLL
ncbi:MAG: ornithine carbamoyltransferase [Candidatus Korarchaeota archaeon]|nr:ornithine carbamoyltransferase [Candidatus Korarchaeota archaeon]NIU83238.1 ornithine carbamoyltransferase [Candidatus Thorarchaeota archaeon]NIW13184.1 ornithine carbamoyltransferase [Candidatus Thorarchaeota archaeon]NIW51325.1 ornithine carbamoyltransferase [Candidatus Korarchaeota archaeon]